VRLQCYYPLNSDPSLLWGTWSPPKAAAHTLIVNYLRTKKKLVTTAWTSSKCRPAVHSILQTQVPKIFSRVREYLSVSEHPRWILLQRNGFPMMSRIMQWANSGTN
jgi:hypothetical protein